MNERDRLIIDALLAGETCDVVGTRYGLSPSGARTVFVRHMGHGLTAPLEQRFWSRVERSDGSGACWSWTGADNGKGYGLVRDGTGGLAYTHRMAWLLTHGPIPAGMLVCHRCDNPPCCNPAHLFVGTYSDNNRDAFAKGRKQPTRLPYERQPRGERHGIARLTTAAVREIRRRVDAGETQFAMARDYGVSRATVSDVIRRRTWGHVA